MKKKLLSILAAFIICLSPVLFLAGCTSQEQNVTITPLTGWSVAKDGSFASMSVPDGFKITYYKNQYNKTANKYEDVKVEITTFADALANGLRVIRGFDSSTVGEGKTMKVIFGGKYFDITYSVTGTDTPPTPNPDLAQHRYIDTNPQDDICDICNKSEAMGNHTQNEIK